MNKNLYILTLCLLLTIGKAQVYFNNRYDLFTRADASNSVFYNQGEYYVPCGGLDITQSDLSLSILKLDLQGVVTTGSHHFKLGNWFYSAQIGKVHPANDSLLLYIGTRVGSGSSMAYTYWFKSNLDSVRYREYGFPTKENVINKYVSDGGNYIYQVGFVDSSYTNTDIFLLKVDTSGHEIWKKQIGLPGWDEVGYCIKMSSDGNLLVSGNKRTHNSYANNGAYILKLDTAGTVLWERHFPSNHGIPAMGLVELVNGDIVVAAARGYGSNVQRPQLIKLDASGNVIFNNVYGITTARAEFYSLIQNDKGNLVAVGQNYYPSQGYYVHGLLYEFNQNGDSLYSREYYIQPNSQNYFRDVVQAPDKGYVFAGFITPLFANGGTGNQDIWLLKTDSSFCTSSSPCGYPTAIDEYRILEGLSIYPNPANNLVHINFEGESEDAVLSLYDVSGRELQQVKLKSNSKQTIDLSAYQSGIYFYKAISGNKVQQNKLVIIK